jgi:hypothetical protein
MTNLLIEIAIGVIITIVVTMLTTLWIKTNNRIKDLFSVFSGCKIFGIKCLVKTRHQGIKKIWNDLLISEEIKVLNFKGYSLLREKNYEQTDLHKLLKKGRIPKVKFLLLNPTEIDVMNERKNSLKKSIAFALDENCNDSVEEIKMTIKTLHSIHINKNININVECLCRLFSENLKWSLILSDKYVLVSCYPKTSTAIDSCGMIVFRDSLLGNSYELYFNELWNKSIDAYGDK